MLLNTAFAFGTAQPSPIAVVQTVLLPCVRRRFKQGVLPASGNDTPLVAVGQRLPVDKSSEVLAHGELASAQRESVQRC